MAIHTDGNEQISVVSFSPGKRRGPGILEKPGLGTEVQSLAGGRSGARVARPRVRSKTLAGTEFGTAEQSGIAGG